MADHILARDDNFVTAMGGVDDVTGVVRPILTDSNGNILAIATGVGAGTVTTVSIVTANGVSGSVANPTTTPAITLTLGDITPSSVTASKAGLPGSFANTTDSASLQVLALSGARATPTANDEIHVSFSLNNTTPAQKEFGRITAKATTVTAASEVGSLDFSTMVAGTLTNQMRLISGALMPTANAGVTLGIATNNWSNVFLSNGNVIAWRDGTNSSSNMTLTHATGSLTFAGGNVLGLGAATATSLATTAGSPFLLTNGQVVTVTLTAQTVGAATLTIPDFANVSDEFTFKTKAQTLSNKTFIAPALGAATATTINGLAITSNGTNTLNITAGKTLAVTQTLTLSGTDSTIMTFPTTSASIARTDAGQTFTGTQVMTTPTITTSLTTGSSSFDLLNTTATTVNFAGAATTMAIGAATALITVPGNIIHTSSALTATGNAATVPITHRTTTVTNNSAATLTITITTTNAVDGQLLMVRVLDATAVAQTLTWVNTENSTVTVPATSNGSTTLPLTVGFQYNSGTSKWRCVASA